MDKDDRSPINSRVIDIAGRLLAATTPARREGGIEKRYNKIKYLTTFYIKI